MKKSFTMSLIALGLLGGLSQAQAAVWNEKVCTTAGPNQVGPGESMQFSFSASASRDSDGTIPVSVYLSTNSTLDGSDQLLASGSVFIPETGPFCSSIVQLYGTMPTQPNGFCFQSGGTGYQIFKAGNDTRATHFAFANDPIPSISEVTPASSQPGMPITIYGNNFDVNHTAVFFGSTEAPRAVVSPTEIYAIVPEGASTGSIVVKRLGPGYEYCAPPSAVASFTVPAPHCNSGASNTGFGNVAYLGAGGAQVYNVVGTASCNNYTNNTGSIISTTQGETGLVLQTQFGACGAPDYSKLFEVYADWNQDSDFDDAGEFLLSAPSVLADTLYDLTIPVPATATPGNVRMRFVMALYYSGIVDSPADVSACGNYPFGETMDFTLRVNESAGVMSAEIMDIENVKAQLKAAEHFLLQQDQSIEQQILTPEKVLEGVQLKQEKAIRTLTYPQYSENFKEQ